MADEGVEVTEEIPKMEAEKAENNNSIIIDQNNKNNDNEDNDDDDDHNNYNSLDDPKCVLEIEISGTDSDNSNSCVITTTRGSNEVSEEKSSSSSPSKILESHNNGKGMSNVSQWKHMLGSVKKKPMRSFSMVPLLPYYESISKKNVERKIYGRIENSADVVIDFERIQMTKPCWRNFDFAELEAATAHFSSENLIGEGGHAQVYKGCLSDGKVVAVKKIVKTENEEDDRTGDFLSELGIIAHINHPNAAKLLGFSIDHGLHLVLEYLPQGSLSSVLHDGAEGLEWKKRLKVAIGVAEGLRYLHHDCRRRIIHRDLKASNILLTEDFEAQISDFGLAKWLPENWLHHIIFPIEGTFGYLAPEYFIHGIADEKTDVFSFGVLLLEIITGRHAVDSSSRQSLVMWAKPLLDNNKIEEIADPRLGNDYDPVEMKHVMLTASMCIQHLPAMRPAMKRVVHLLKGEETSSEVQERTDEGRSLDDWELQDYTCTSYLNDMNRYMQLVME